MSIWVRGMGIFGNKSRTNSATNRSLIADLRLGIMWLYHFL